MSGATISELTGEDEWRAAFGVMRQLRDHLSEDEYLGLLHEMAVDGYRLFALQEDGATRALAGVGFRTNFYYGRYLYVYDLITDEEARSRGHGERLLRHLEDLARAEGCDTIALSSGVHRKDAHRFYRDRMGYEMPSYVFTKAL